MLRIYRRNNVSLFVVIPAILIFLLFSSNIYAEQKKSNNGVSTSVDKKIANTPEEKKANEEAPAYEFKAPKFEETKVSYPLLILKTIAVLIVIVVSIFIIFRILVKNKHRIITDSDIIKVLATFPLAAGKVIQIIEIAGKVMVLGITENNINLITTIEDKEIIDSIKLQYSKENNRKTGFKDQFFKLIGGGVFGKTGQISYLDNYRKRIKKIKKL